MFKELNRYLLRVTDVAHKPKANKMKTANKNIDIFTTEEKARKFFNSLAISARILKATNGNYYVERNTKTALENYPRLYTLVCEK